MRKINKEQVAKADFKEKRKINAKKDVAWLEEEEM
jgi:hypothetical protein